MISQSDFEFCEISSNIENDESMNEKSFCSTLQNEAQYFYVWMITEEVKWPEKVTPSDL